MQKRTYVPKPNRSKRNTVVILLVILAVLFAVPYTRSGIRRIFGAVGTPALRTASSGTSWLSRTRAVLHEKSTLVEENRNLQARVAALSAELSGFDALARENADLKAVLGRTENAQFVLAAILAKPPHSMYDTLVIDGGASAGMAVDKIVYANGETPIGRISSVTPTTAVVQLYSAPGEATEARLTPSNVDVTLRGHGGGNFEMEVPHDLSVTEGSVVVTKDLDPKVIALFKKVTSDARDPFQTILLESPINVMQLAFVQVKK